MNYQQPSESVSPPKFAPDAVGPLLRRRRVLILITGLQYGGAESQVIALARGLQKRAWEVAIVSMIMPGGLAGSLEGSGILVQTLGMPRGIPDPRGILRFARIVRQWNPDVVHSHMVHANLLARITRLFTPMRKLICTAHNLREEAERGGPTWHKELLYRLTDPLADHTTIISQAAHDRYVAVGAARRHRISVIPNGVDTNRFAPSREVRLRTRRKLGLSDEFLWMAVGRLVPQKDYPSLLRAFAKLGDARTVLMIAGNGDLLEQLKSYASNLGITDRVRFAGVQPDISDWYNAADAFVMSSVFEGLSVALLEAAATGLPCVVTDVGGNGEIVLDGVNGYLVPPQDATSLSGAMERLMKLPDAELACLSQASRNHCVTNYSLDQIIWKWEGAYGFGQDAVGQGGPIHAAVQQY